MFQKNIIILLCIFGFTTATLSSTIMVTPEGKGKKFEDRYVDDLSTNRVFRKIMGGKSKLGGITTTGKQNSPTSIGSRDVFDSPVFSKIMMGTEKRATLSSLPFEFPTYMDFLGNSSLESSKLEKIQDAINSMKDIPFHLDCTIIEGNSEQHSDGPDSVMRIMVENILDYSDSDEEDDHPFPLLQDSEGNDLSIIEVDPCDDDDRYVIDDEDEIEYDCSSSDEDNDDVSTIQAPYSEDDLRYSSDSGITKKFSDID